MNPLVPLESLDRYADKLDEFIRLAHEYRHDQRDVQFYLYEPCYLNPKEEARARELAAASPHAAHSLVA